MAEHSAADERTVYVRKMTAVDAGNRRSTASTLPRLSAAPGEERSMHGTDSGSRAQGFEAGNSS